MLVNCFLLWLVHCKGVQLSQLHQQSCWAAAWLVHCKGVQLSQLHQQSCLVATWLVHLRQVHPLKLLHEHLLHLATCCAHDVDAALQILHAYAAEGVDGYIPVVVGCSERIDCCRVGVFLAEHYVYV